MRPPPGALMGPHWLCVRPPGTFTGHHWLCLQVCGPAASTWHFYRASLAVLTSVWPCRVHLALSQGIIGYAYECVALPGLAGTFTGHHWLCCADECVTLPRG